MSNDYWSNYIEKNLQNRFLLRISYPYWLVLKEWNRSQNEKLAQGYFYEGSTYLDDAFFFPNANSW